jgi:hypothetical protein
MRASRSGGSCARRAEGIGGGDWSGKRNKEAHYETHTISSHVCYSVCGAGHGSINASASTQCCSSSTGTDPCQGITVRSDCDANDSPPCGTLRAVSRHLTPCQLVHSDQRHLWQRRQSHEFDKLFYASVSGRARFAWWYDRHDERQLPASARIPGSRGVTI